MFQVSWIRQRDLHILTVGILTYTNDQRFQSLHSDGTDEWTLKISSPQERDSGAYECQVSTEPKMSLAFKLNVVGEFFVRKILYTMGLWLWRYILFKLTCLFEKKWSKERLLTHKKLFPFNTATKITNSRKLFLKIIVYDRDYEF